MSDNLVAGYNRAVITSLSAHLLKKFQSGMTQDWGEEVNIQFPAHAVGLPNVVGEADTARLDLNQHLTSAWRDHGDIFDDQRCTCLFEGSFLVLRRETHCKDVWELACGVDCVEWREVIVRGNCEQISFLNNSFRP